jgi:hypothetical protein
MEHSLKMRTSWIVLVGLLALQVHVLFDDHSAKPGIGEHDDECQLCSTALSLKSTSAVQSPVITPRWIAVAIEIPLEPKAVSIAAVKLPDLRGPPVPLES